MQYHIARDREERVVGCAVSQMMPRSYQLPSMPLMFTCTMVDTSSLRPLASREGGATQQRRCLLGFAFFDRSIPPVASRSFLRGG